MLIVMAIVYRQGPEGQGRPADIMMQRFVIPEDEIEFKYNSDGKIVGVLSVEGNPYRFENAVGNWVIDPPVPYSYNTINFRSELPNPAPPT